MPKKGKTKKRPALKTSPRDRRRSAIQFDYQAPEMTSHEQHYLDEDAQSNRRKREIAPVIRNVQFTAA